MGRLKAYLRERTSISAWERSRYWEEHRPIALPAAVRKLELGESEPSEEMPSPMEREAILRKIWSHWRASRTLDGLERAELRWLPLLLFETIEEVSKIPLGEETGFKEIFFHWIDRNGRTPPLLALTKSFLLRYPFELASFSDWRKGILQRLMQSPSLQASRWVERDRDWGLLSRDGAKRLGKAISEGRTNSKELLESAGLVGVLSDARVIRLAVVWALQEAARRLSAGEQISEKGLENLLDVLQEHGRFRYPELREDVAEALLGPFAQREPPEELRRGLKQFFLRHYGDPRGLGTGWSLVAQRLRLTFRRWLVRESFEAFFVALDETSAVRLQWKQRREFWWRYLVSGQVVDAWAVLCPAASMFAKRRLDASTESFGTLETEGTQSVLLMRIAGPRGVVVIAEWSHQERCRGWPDGDSKAPKFYEPRYRPAELKARAPLAEIHHGIEWMGKVQRWIHANTGTYV